VQAKMSAPEPLQLEAASANPTQLLADGWLQDIARSAASSGCTEDPGDSETWMPRSALFSGLGVTRAGQRPAGRPGPGPALGPA